jgi:CBS domain-containing protein
MQISQHMKKNVVSIHATAKIRDAAQVFVKQHIGMLPVVDKKNKPVGVVGLQDMLALELPDFVKLIADLDFVQDFGAVETTRPSASALSRSVKELMRPPISDILVVSPEGALVGIASRVDIGRAILSTWSKIDKK